MGTMRKGRIGHLKKTDGTISCPVCRTANNEYSTICSECGSYLQNRVPNLDLFYTAWKIIENPRSAYRLIVLSEHKNYVFLLYSLFGIDIAFALLWLFRMGEIFSSIITLILWAFLTGVGLGLILCQAVSLLHWLQTKMYGGLSSYRISLGITAYSFIPVILSFIIGMPIKLLTFGMYYFTFNPNPMTINSISYITLTGIDFIAFIWSFGMLVYGTMRGNQVTVVKALLINCAIAAVISYILINVMHAVLSLNF
jgi:hypothetical protein